MNVDSMYHRQSKQISSVLASFPVIFQAKERSNDNVPTSSEWIVASLHGYVLLCFVRPAFERILKKVKMGDDRWDLIAVHADGWHETRFQDA